MKRNCDKCGREAKEGEMFVTFINPNSDWWLHLADKIYCKECANKLKAIRQTVRKE